MRITNLTEMIEPKLRYGTQKAIDELAKELELPNEPWMQDWPFEVIKVDDIEKYINHYRLLKNDDKKFLLMEGIIQAANEQEEIANFHKYWAIIRNLLIDNFSIHEYSIFDWSCFESNDLTECWKITPFMRELWYKHHNNLPNI